MCGVWCAKEKFLVWLYCKANMQKSILILLAFIIIILIATVNKFEYDEHGSGATTDLPTAVVTTTIASSSRSAHKRNVATVSFIAKIKERASAGPIRRRHRVVKGLTTSAPQRWSAPQIHPLEIPEELSLEIEDIEAYERNRANDQEVNLSMQYCNLTNLNATAPISTATIASCTVANKFHQLPTFAFNDARRTVWLTVRYQKNLRLLRQTDLTFFKNMKRFILTDSGLKWIDAETFSRNQHISVVDLRRNQLHTLDWRSLKYTSNAIVYLNDNPFRCNCSIYWLAVWEETVSRYVEHTSKHGAVAYLSSKTVLLLPGILADKDLIRCNATISLRTWLTKSNQSAYDKCELPQVSMEPQNSDYYVNSNTSFGPFRCLVKFKPTLKLNAGSDFTYYVVHQEPDTYYLKTVVDADKEVKDINIEKMSVNQMGWYICIGQSAAGPSFNATFLTVHTPPVITLVESTRYSENGSLMDEFLFRVTTSTHAYSLNITILKNGMELQNDSLNERGLFVATSFLEPTLENLKLAYFPNVTITVDVSKMDRTKSTTLTLMICNVHGCDTAPITNYNSTWLNQKFKQADTFSHGNSVIAPEKLWLIVVGTVCSVVIMCCTGIVIWLRTRPSSQQARDKDTMKSNEIIPLNMLTENELYESIRTREIPVLPKQSLELLRILGQGAFGRVYLASCKMPFGIYGAKTSESKSDNCMLVAAKTLTGLNLTSSDEFAREAELMAKFKHENIVTFYGISVNNDGKDLLLIFEYMEFGDLRKFLNLHGPHPELVGAPEDTWRLTNGQLLDMAKQVVYGLAYLHSKHFVHRDLACRNCLVKSPLIVKLSDFGMSRSVYSNDYYRLTHVEPLPVRWLPPESIMYGRFSEQSDIWSYGVVVWEIVNYGKLPWAGLTNVEVMQKVTAGEWLPDTPECDSILEAIMHGCWHRVPAERMRVEEILRRLKEHL